MKVLDLRNAIQALLSEELGTYTLPGGFETPAIVVLSTGEVLSDRTVSGLEVVIRRSPVRDEGAECFDCVRAVKTWQVFLVQWGGDYTIDDAKEKIRQKFPGSVAVTLNIDKGGAIREQISLKLPDILDANDWI